MTRGVPEQVHRPPPQRQRPHPPLTLSSGGTYHGVDVLVGDSDDTDTATVSSFQDEETVLPATDGLSAAQVDEQANDVLSMDCTSRQLA